MTPSPPPPSSGSPASRIVVTLLLAGGFAALCWADATAALAAPPGWWLAPVAALLAWGAAGEALRLAGLAVPLAPTATAAVPLIALATGSFPHRLVAGPTAAVGWASVAATAAVALLFAAELFRYRRGAGALARLAGGSLAVTAIGMPLAFMAALRLLGTGTGWGRGLVPLLSMVAVVKLGDIAAYVTGSLIGRHRMAPVVSPGKTWEGGAASLAASLAASWAILEWSGLAGSTRPWGGWWAYGLSVGAAGMLGDLSESLVKRELAAKDSGRSLGGLGGVLDLVDATLVAAPVAWLLWVLGGAG